MTSPTTISPAILARTVAAALNAQADPGLQAQWDALYDEARTGC